MFVKGVGVGVVDCDNVRFDDDTMWVPLVWFPRLLHATPQQREGFTLSPNGLHWEGLDEDISLSGLLAGRGDMAKLGQVA